MVSDSGPAGSSIASFDPGTILLLRRGRMAWIMWSAFDSPPTTTTSVQKRIRNDTTETYG
jgi:hypothetical protein